MLSAILTLRTNCTANSKRHTVNKIFAILLLTSGSCIGQNLVPNDGFEIHTSCPYVGNSFSTLSYWFNPSLNLGWGSTPDYYNGCSTLLNDVDVPSNWAGYQFARNGVAYVGIVLWHNQLTFREYFSVQLISPLVAGTSYHFEMYFNLANQFKYSCSNIGVYFSDTLYTSTINYDPLPFNPQINNINSNYPDTINWSMVSGNYVAHGGENYIIIGNFQNDSNSYPILVDSNAFESGTYVFIDDVSLTVYTGITEQEKIEVIKVYPTLFADKLYLSCEVNESCCVILYDETFRKIIQLPFTKNASLNTGHLAKGMYFYEVRCGSSLCKKGKLVKD